MTVIFKIIFIGSVMKISHLRPVHTRSVVSQIKLIEKGGGQFNRYFLILKINFSGQNHCQIPQKSVWKKYSSRTEGFIIQ